MKTGFLMGRIQIGLYAVVSLGLLDTFYLLLERPLC